MAKIKMTMKEISKSDGYKVQLNFGEARSLLSCIQPIAYNEGKNGWNFDVYLWYIHGEKVWITVGVRGLIGERLGEAVEPYEKDAEKILAEWAKGLLNTTETRDKINFLVDQWLTNGLGL